MLELRPNCEHCARRLPPNSSLAMICSFECTFCRECVETVLENVCPNCGGGFVMRPVRPAYLLEKYPPASTPVLQPADPQKLMQLKQRFGHISPENR